MERKMDLSLNLEKKQLDWLESMTRKYNLPSVGKALRISILYSKHVAEDAGISAKSTSPDSNNLIRSYQQVYNMQDNYLQDLVVKYDLGSKDRAARLLLDYVMGSTNEATIFKVKRCRNCSG